MPAAIFLFLLLAWPGPASATITLVTNPRAIAIEPGTTERVEVIARASGSSATDNLRLSVAPAAGVSHRVIGMTRPAARATALVWIVEIAAAPDLRSDATLVFRLDQGRRPGARAASASLRVSPAAIAPGASQATAELVLGADTLLDRQTGIVHLKITNLSNAELAITKVRFYRPSFLRAGPVPAGPWRIAPRAILIQPIRLSIASDSEHPLLSGRHPIVAVITVRRTSPERPWQGDIAASQTLSLGIPGLNEMQGLVQVPSFLLLPGFLIVTCFLLVWRFRRPRAAGETGLAQFTIGWSPGLWVVAITLSGVAVAIYPWLTRRALGARRDVLIGFDLSDVIRVWFWSMLAGALAAALARAMLAMWQWGRARYAFKGGEDPLAFLRRLQRKRVSHKFKYVSVDSDERRLHALDLETPGDTVWAAPAIAWKPSDGFKSTEFVATIRTGTLDSLLGQIQAAIDTGALTLEWQAASELSKPARVPRTRFATGLLDPTSIIREEPLRSNGGAL